MQCSTHEALASLFFNVSTSSYLLLLVLYSAVSLLLKLFHFIGGYPLLQRSEDEYDSVWFSDEEEEEEEDEEAISSNTNYHVISRESNHLIADILDGGESLVFYNPKDEPNTRTKEFVYVHEEHHHQTKTHLHIEDQDSSSSSTEVQFSARDSSCLSESKEDDDDGKVDDVVVDDDDDDDVFDDDGEIRLPSYDVDDDSTHTSSGPTRQEHLQSGLVFHDKSYDGIMFCPFLTFFFYFWG